MRLTKDNNHKNEKKRLNKNKSLIEDKSNIKYKMENTYLQEKLKKYNNNLLKENQKVKNLKESIGSKQFQSNINIYKNNKKLISKKNLQNIKDVEKNSIYSKNKTISLNTNNNINIGNNINIITNNHILENNDNTKDNQLKNNLLDKNRGIITDYNLTKKINNEMYNNNLNNIININDDDINRMKRIKEATGNVDRKFKAKNTSMEHRYSRFNKDIVMSDGDLMNDEDNFQIRRNHIYSHPYKYNSPNSFYDYTYKHQFNANNEEKNILNDNCLYNKNFTNLDDDGDRFYNNFYKLKYEKKSNNNNNNNRNKYNSLLSYNEKMNKFNYTNDIQSKTSNSFYIRKSPLNTLNNKNLITNRDFSEDKDEKEQNIYSSYMNYMNNNNRENKKTTKHKGKYHSMIEDNELPLSPYRNYANTNNNYPDNNYNPDEFHSIRRSKNRIRIIKKNNNTSIQEYNLSLGGDNDMDNYQNEFRMMDNRFNNNYHEPYDLKMHYNHFSKNRLSITNSQFNINSKNSNINLTKENYNSNKTNNISNSSLNKKSNLSNNKNNINSSKSSNNLISTPNFSDTGKTPNRYDNSSNQKVKAFNNNETNEKNNSNSINNSNNEENSQYKIMVKKRAKNDIPIPSGGMKRRNSSSNSLNKNINKNINYEICYNEKINFIPINEEKNIKQENKFLFENENEIIDYIYNKFEEERKKKSYFNRKLRFTGFVLSKKYKGKNLYDVRIEDDIDKINQQLKDEHILINEKQVEFKFVEENKIEENKDVINDDKKYNELIEENKLLKLEKEKMNKKDIVKNELIKKLDNEKQNLIEEIEKLKNEIEDLKGINNKNKAPLKIENNILFYINKINEKNKEQNSNMIENIIRNEENKEKEFYIKENKNLLDIINNSGVHDENNNSEKKEKKEKKLINLINIIKNRNENEKKYEKIENTEVNKKFDDNIIFNEDINTQKNNFLGNNLTNKEEVNSQEEI